MEPALIAAWLAEGARWLAGGALVVSGIVAATHWAVRRGSLQPFAGWPRFVRRWSDPMLRPVERRVVRAGGNPQDAPLWLMGATVVAGLLLIAVTGWLLSFLVGLTAALGGQVSPAVLVLYYTFRLVIFALMVRVVASWFGASPHSWWMRIAHHLTDWIVDPLRRVLPTFGPLDLSPLAAYFLLSFTQQMVLRAFL